MTIAVNRNSQKKRFFGASGLVVVVLFLFFFPSVGVMIAITIFNSSTRVKMATQPALDPRIYIWKVQGIRRTIKGFIKVYYHVAIHTCVCLQCIQHLQC